MSPSPLLVNWTFQPWLCAPEKTFPALQFVARWDTYQGRSLTSTDLGAYYAFCSGSGEEGAAGAFDDSPREEAARYGSDTRGWQ